MLALEKVSVSYGPIRAVRDVTFSIEEGDVVALLGPNGAGKTTLLSAVMGLVPVAAGSVTFGNEVITGGRVEDIVRHGITMVPEGRQIFATLTVEENLRLPILGRSRESEQSWGMDDVLGLFPVLRDRLRARAGSLSGGQQQQLAVARALMSNARLLMLDEPSLGLAPKLVESIFELIRELAGSGVTLLIVEQNATEALAVADRAVVLANGELKYDGSSKGLLDSEDLVNSYFGAALDRPDGTPQ